MSELRKYFDENPGRLMHKWHHYFEIYERHFEQFRQKKELHVIEFGVSHGGSLQMWKHYFPHAQVYGVDINPICSQLAEERIQILIGDQANREYLRSLRTLPRFDIVIDDGGHTMEQQMATFEELFDHVADDGVYLCEDVHTSYWERYGGGVGRVTFVEQAKALVDQLNAWHSEDQEALFVDDFTRSAHSIHFYNSVVVIEKRPMGPPTVGKTGTPSF